MEKIKMEEEEEEEIAFNKIKYRKKKKWGEQAR